MDTGFVEDWRRRSQQSSFNPGGSKEDLFLLYCDKVESGDIIPTRTSASDVVDNFYVNGDFVYRSDYGEKQWQAVKMRALVANDEIAIYQF